jgi:hypothetical protein
VDERPAAAEGRREQCGVLVFGGHQDTAAFPVKEVSGLGQAHQWAADRVADVDDEVLVVDLGDARVFYAPVLLEALTLRM